MTPVLTKHHAFGNDFLVLVDLDGEVVVDAALARALCHRTEGVGADGLIHVTAPSHGTAQEDVDGAQVTMRLRNADGGEAEMSGNGIRCLAQAVIDAGVCDGPELRVATAAGLRVLVVEPETAPGLRQVRVHMGPVTVEARQVDFAERAASVDTGNPHLVVLDEHGRLDLLALGAEHPDLNLELVAVTGPDELTMRVHERGAGETRACGTGSCAAAAAAHQWGLVGSHVVVKNPGGPLTVDLEDGAAFLTGPTQLVAHIGVASVAGTRLERRP